MIMNIASAHAARTPLLVLASNMQIAGDDREAFIQTGYQQPITSGMKKYGKRLIAPDRVWEYGAYAFRNMKSGRAGTGASRFPRRSGARALHRPGEAEGLSTTRTSTAPNRARIPRRRTCKKAVDMIAKAERPLIVAGQGVFQRKAGMRSRRSRRRTTSRWSTSGPMRGHFPDDHRLSPACRPMRSCRADLVIFVGQYCMPSPGEYRFNPDIKAIRVHPVQEDLGRNWPLDLGIVSDEQTFLTRWTTVFPRRKRDAWVDGNRRRARQKFEKTNLEHYELGLKYSQRHESPASGGDRARRSTTSSIRARSIPSRP